MVVSVPATTFIALVLNMFINKPTVVAKARSYDHEFTRSTMNKIIVISYLDNTDVSIALEEVGAQIA
jgi:hypothetical protein